MLRILIASSKGGCGKTTLATHLAAYWAVAGKATVLVDGDRLGLARRWCERRAGLASAVLPIDGTRRGWRERIPADAQRVVIDTAAGIRAEEVESLLGDIDALLIPVLPAPFDLDATEAFIADLARLDRIRRGKVAAGLVANRLKPWTRASQEALERLHGLPFPVVATLRDSIGYSFCTGLGKSLFDYHAESVRLHQDDWKPLRRWLKQAK